MRKAIDTAPRNGDFIILEDAARGTLAVVRWSADAAQWLDEKGTPSQLNATHWHSPQSRDEKGTPSQLNETYWHPLTPAQSVVETADEIGSLTGPSKPSAWRNHRGASRPASGGMTAQPQRAAKPGRSVNVWARFVGFAGRGCGKILSAFARCRWLDRPQPTQHRDDGCLPARRRGVRAIPLSQRSRQVGPPSDSIGERHRVEASASTGTGMGQQACQRCDSGAARSRIAGGVDPQGKRSGRPGERGQ